MDSSVNKVVSVDAIGDILDKISLWEAEDSVHAFESNDANHKEETNAEPVAINSYESSSHTPCNPQKLVSSMKGSRGKNGAPSRKMSVTWSPDVYDPVPNSLSHTVKGKMKSKKGKNKDKRRSKKNKKGQKGNVLNGSNVNNKTQIHNHGIRTVERFAGDLIQFNVGSPDFYGSSLQSQTNFQFLLC